MNDATLRPWLSHLLEGVVRTTRAWCRDDGDRVVTKPMSYRR